MDKLYNNYEVYNLRGNLKWKIINLLQLILMI